MATYRGKSKTGRVKVGVRLKRGADETTITLDSLDDFRALQAYERECRELYRRHKIDYRIDPERFIAELHRQRSLAEANGAHSVEHWIRSVTWLEFIGDPLQGVLGKFFTVNKRPRRNRQLEYQTMLRQRMFPFVGDAVTIGDLTTDMAGELVDWWISCPRCEDRYIVAGHEPAPWRSDLPPFEGHCRKHRARWTRSTLLATVRMFKTMSKFARMFDESLPNPWQHITIPVFPEPLRRTRRPALGPAEVRALLDALDPRHRAAVAVAVGAQLRVGELCGLNTNCYIPAAGGELPFLLIAQSYTANRGGKAWVLSDHTKTPRSGSQAEPARVPLAAWAAEELDAFLAVDLQPSLTTCTACADGVRALPPRWYRTGDNPHTGCRFADDAPTFRGVGGARLTPAVLRTALRRAADGLGLGHVTPHLLRASGATHATLAGVNEEMANRLGRWTSSQVRNRHYFKPATADEKAAMDTLDRAFRIGAGLDAPLEGDPGERVRWLTARVEALESERTRRDAVAARRHPSARRPIWDPPADQFIAVCAAAPSVFAALRELGAAAARPNYRSLKKRCLQLGIEPPPERGTAAADAA